MDSDQGSVLSPSTTQDSFVSESKASSTWVHSRPARDGENSVNRYCIHCTEDPYNTSVTTNFRVHLKSKHKVIVDTKKSAIHIVAAHQLEQLYHQAEANGEADELDTHIFRKHLNRDVINEALVTLIVQRNLSFRAVEWPELHTLCQAFNPLAAGFMTTTHSNIHKKIEGSFLTHKDTVRRRLQSAASSVHLSLDIWTSPNGHSLLGTCAHFVSSSDQHMKALISLRPVANHSGAEQLSSLIPVFQDYGISHKVGAVVSDNATPNDTLCRAMEVHLRDEEGVEWDSMHWRIRCTGHIINLAVQAFLFYNVFETDQLESYNAKETRGEMEGSEETQSAFRLLGPLGKLHNIVVHTRGSSGRIKEFKTLAGRMIPLDNRTRWNSWYSMLLVAVEKEGAVDTYSKKHFAVLQTDFLSPEDWERLRMIKDFLEPFHLATLETQGDSATLDKVLFTMDVLVRYFETSLVSK